MISYQFLYLVHINDREMYGIVKKNKNKKKRQHKLLLKKKIHMHVIEKELGVIFIRKDGGPIHYPLPVYYQKLFIKSPI